jgi:hypothetical protein
MKNDEKQWTPLDLQHDCHNLPKLLILPIFPEKNTLIVKGGAK